MGFLLLLLPRDSLSFEIPYPWEIDVLESDLLDPPTNSPVPFDAATRSASQTSPPPIHTDFLPSDSPVASTAPSPAPESSSGLLSGEKFVTLVVILSVFSLFIIVLAVLCCSRRSFIGKPARKPSPERINRDYILGNFASGEVMESLETVRAYTDAGQIGP
jgi:hypothetical protein